MHSFIVLLRGINVSGHNKVPMPELRQICAELGWNNIQTYINSGNVVCAAEGTPATLETALEDAIKRRFGLTLSVIVRLATDWPAYVRGNPFPDASEREPNLVMMALPKLAPKVDAVEKLRERAVSGERIQLVGDALWIHYAEGVARSKLSPSLTDRLVGSPVTARNWRTVLKLEAMTGVSP